MTAILDAHFLGKVLILPQFERVLDSDERVLFLDCLGDGRVDPGIGCPRVGHIVGTWFQEIDLGLVCNQDTSIGVVVVGAWVQIDEREIGNLSQPDHPFVVPVPPV